MVSETSSTSPLNFIFSIAFDCMIELFIFQLFIFQLDLRNASSR